MRRPIPRYLCQVARELFSRHFDRASATLSDYNPSDDSSQRIPTGTALDIATLEPGAIVVYDMERLLPPNKMKQNYDIKRLDLSWATQVLNWVNHFSPDFVKSSNALIPAGEGVWMPRRMIAISNGLGGAQAREYVRQAGIGMVLPTRNGVQLAEPTLPLYAQDAAIIPATWQPVNLPSSIVGFTNWEKPQFGPPSAHRLRTAWLYDRSAEDWRQLALPEKPGLKEFIGRSLTFAAAAYSLASVSASHLTQEFNENQSQR